MTNEPARIPARIHKTVRAPEPSLETETTPENATTSLRPPLTSGDIAALMDALLDRITNLNERADRLRLEFRCYDRALQTDRRAQELGELLRKLDSILK